MDPVRRVGEIGMDKHRQIPDQVHQIPQKHSGFSTILLYQLPGLLVLKTFVADRGQGKDATQPVPKLDPLQGVEDFLFHPLDLPPVLLGCVAGCRTVSCRTVACRRVGLSRPGQPAVEVAVDKGEGPVDQVG